MEFKDAKTKKDRVAIIREKLKTDARWAIRGMLRVFDNQTSDEQILEGTKYHNGIGFTGADASLLSSFSKQVRWGRSMSAKQMALIFKKMPKYAGQLEATVAADKASKAVEDKPAAVEERMHKMAADAERESEAHGAWSSMR